MNFSKSKYAILPLVLGVLAAPSLAAAQSASGLSGLFACETVSGETAQLSCFLEETAKLRAAPTPQNITPPAVSSKVVTEAPTDDPEKFLPIPKDTTPKSRTLTIERTTTYGRDKYVRFFLANGEVWQQIDSGHFRLGKGSPDKITIKKAALGSFRARVNDKAPSIRVRRLK